MSKKDETTLVRQGRELVRQSKQLCDASHQRIERGKRLREDVCEQTSKADRGNRKRAA